jgi:hypothetical protein
MPHTRQYDFVRHVQGMGFVCHYGVSSEVVECLPEDFLNVVCHLLEAFFGVELYLLGAP